MPRNAASSSVPPKDAARLRLSGDIQKRRLAETGAMRIPSTAPSALHKLAKATKQLGRASNSGDQVGSCPG